MELNRHRNKLDGNEQTINHSSWGESVSWVGRLELPFCGCIILLLPYTKVPTRPQSVPPARLTAAHGWSLTASMQATERSNSPREKPSHNPSLLSPASDSALFLSISSIPNSMECLCCISLVVHPTIVSAKPGTTLLYFSRISAGGIGPVKAESVCWATTCLASLEFSNNTGPPACCTGGPETDSFFLSWPMQIFCLVQGLAQAIADLFPIRRKGLTVGTFHQGFMALSHPTQGHSSVTTGKIENFTHTGQNGLMPVHCCLQLL